MYALVVPVVLRVHQDPPAARAVVEVLVVIPGLVVRGVHLHQVHATGEGVAEVDGVEGNDAARALGLLQGLAPLESLLPPHLVLVELGKVVDNDGDGQRDNQHAAYTTHTTHDLA